MLSGLPFPLLVVIFLISAVVVWIAGVYLSDSTDTLSTRYHLGEAFAGAVLLSIVEDLPEVTITASGSLQHHFGIVIGNLLGGIAMQTLVLAGLDVVGVPTRPLTYRAASLVLVLQGTLVTAVLSVTVLATQMPNSLIFLHLTPGVIGITAVWLIGLWLVRKARGNLPWQNRGTAPGAQEPGVAAARRRHMQAEGRESNTRVIIVFLIAAAATLVAGVALEESSNTIAGHVGLSSVIFASTFLALVTSLPEFSVGLTAVRIGDYQLAVSEIFGSNAFLPVLFLLATLLSGEAVLPNAGKSNIYLTSLGILLTTIYIVGLIFRPPREFLRMGPDSIAVTICYLAGIAGLVAVTHA